MYATDERNAIGNKTNENKKKKTQTISTQFCACVLCVVIGNFIYWDHFQRLYPSSVDTKLWCRWQPKQ